MRLLQARGAGRFELGWKQAPRGAVAGNRPEDGTPLFAEMAALGTVFEGLWRENPYLAQPGVIRALRWREPVSIARILESANTYAAKLLEIQKQYAAWANLPLVATQYWQVGEAQRDGDREREAGTVDRMRKAVEREDGRSAARLVDRSDQPCSSRSSRAFHGSPVSPLGRAIRRIRRRSPDCHDKKMYVPEISRFLGIVIRMFADLAHHTTSPTVTRTIKTTWGSSALTLSS